MVENSQSTPQILPNTNPNHGFYGECKRACAPADIYWNLTSEFLITNLQLSPEDTRNYLEGKTGRWLGDDLFGNAPEEAMFNVQHLKQYLANKSLSSHWRRSVLQDIEILRQESAIMPKGQFHSWDHK